MFSNQRAKSTPMSESKRLILWPSDGPLNARDNVLEYLRARIDENVSEAKEDPAFLNYVAAYIRCLIGVMRETGGGIMVSEHFAGWQRTTLKVYDGMKNPAEEVKEDRGFLTSLFEELHGLSET
jgi:hypothetical protein